MTSTSSSPLSISSALVIPSAAGTCGADGEVTAGRDADTDGKVVVLVSAIIVLVCRIVMVLVMSSEGLPVSLLNISVAVRRATNGGGRRSTYDALATVSVRYTVGLVLMYVVVGSRVVTCVVSISVTNSLSIVVLIEKVVNSSVTFAT